MAYTIGIWAISLLMKSKTGFKDSLSVGYTCRIRNATTTMEHGKAHGRNKGKYGTKTNAGSVWLIKPEGQNMLRASYKMITGTVEPVVARQVKRIENTLACHWRAKVNFSHSTPWKHVSLYVFGETALSGPGPPHSWGFLDHTQRRTPLGRTTLDEWSARRTDLDLTKHNTQQTNIYAPGQIRTQNLNRRAAADLRLRPRGNWDRHRSMYTVLKEVSGQHQAPTILLQARVPIRTE